MMYEIITGVKRNDGIIVVFEEKNQMKSIFFEYGDLIDQKVNALDLLDHPKMYKVDPEKSAIRMIS
jgi:hypothetical protein